MATAAGRPHIITAEATCVLSPLQGFPVADLPRHLVNTVFPYSYSPGPHRN